MASSDIEEVLGMARNVIVEHASAAGRVATYRRGEADVASRLGGITHPSRSSMSNVSLRSRFRLGGMGATASGCFCVRIVAGGGSHCSR